MKCAAMILLIINLFFMWLQWDRNGQQKRQIYQLRKENQQLKELILNKQNKLPTLSAQHDIKKDLTFNLARPHNDKDALHLKTFIDSVSILLFDVSKSSNKCQQVGLRKKAIEALFPGVKILSSSSNEAEQTMATALNSLFPLVTTKYFLLLDSRYELDDYDSDHSVKWLLHALINVPELDFVSGSILRNNYLEIPCYRLSLCNWTLSQRYEYKRSIGELMICENIASSFMGKTDRIQALFGNESTPFDVKLPVLSATDFFLRAKWKGAVVAVLPEVFLTLSRNCQSPLAVNKSDKKTYEWFVPFAEKHKIFRFKDADSNILDLCGNDSPLLGESICDEQTAHKIMLDNSHWAYSGTFAYPYIIDNLLKGLFAVTDFLHSRNITYFLDGGVPLGALKMQRILPWEAGDVDMAVYIESQKKLLSLIEGFAAPHGYTVRNLDGQVQVFAAPRKAGMRMGGLISMFPHLNPAPDSKEFIKIKISGRWLQCRKDLFAMFKKYYGINYLQHQMYYTSQIVHCKKKSHNACLPDFRTLESLQGTAGSYREYFCDS